MLMIVGLYTVVRMFKVMSLLVIVRLLVDVRRLLLLVDRLVDVACKGAAGTW